MKMIRIFLLTILIVGFIGIIPRSWSWADSHTETPAANDSTNNMSSEEKCEEENYRSFERCMNPCMSNDENYKKALKLYGKSMAFEGADRTFLYCSARCNARTERIDCSNPDRSVINQLKTFGKGNLLLRIDENNTLTIVVIQKKALDRPKEIQVTRGNLLAKREDEITPREQKPYAAPKNIADVKAALNEILTIEDAYAYLQKAREDFPKYRELNDRSSNMERQVERAMERQRGELLDLESYFGVLHGNLDNAQWWLRRAVNEGVSDEKIQNEIKKRRADLMATTISDTRTKIKNAFPHLDFMRAMDQYLNQLRSADPVKEFILNIQYTGKD